MTRDYLIETCSKEHINTIVDGINAYNLSYVPATAETWTPLEFSVTNSDGHIMGGVLGGIGYWNGLEIKILWVDEAYRKSGIGSELLNHIEQIAREKGVTISMVDTFDFQAPAFYLKNGYSQIGKIEGFPPGRNRLYFSKKLN